MAASSSSKDKFFDNVIIPYLREVMQHPHAVQMHDGVMHIRDVQGPKGTGSLEASLEAMEQEVFRCKGMVERALNANHLMIADYTRDLNMDGKSMKDIVFSLNEQVNFLHSKIHDLQSQLFEYEAKFEDLDHHGLIKLLQGQILREGHQPLLARADEAPSNNSYV
ncbi:40S ribosomal protein S5-1 [Hordeum vulgare]|nr:40S ribosomal protein S5-1 [Hordeum vulgare]